MRNLNIGGKWMDEFVKIASDKGWVTKEEKHKRFRLRAVI